MFIIRGVHHKVFLLQFGVYQYLILCFLYCLSSLIGIRASASSTASSATLSSFTLSSSLTLPLPWPLPLHSQPPCVVGFTQVCRCYNSSWLSPDLCVTIVPGTDLDHLIIQMFILHSQKMFESSLLKVGLRIYGFYKKWCDTTFTYLLDKQEQTQYLGIMISLDNHFAMDFTKKIMVRSNPMWLKNFNHHVSLLTLIFANTDGSLMFWICTLTVGYHFSLLCWISGVFNIKRMLSM